MCHTRDMTTWMLEVQRFDDETWKQFWKDGERRDVSQEMEDRHYIGKFVHVGYMQKRFTTKKAAVEYYNSHNAHMRQLDANNTCKSDWDPATLLRYIPRLFHGARMTVRPFE